MRSRLILKRDGATRHGFTLVELLVVLGIVGILAALIIPSVGALTRSYNLTRATSQVIDELTFARQAALTRNADVEVRFYKIGSAGNSTDLQYRAFRTYLANATTPSQAVALNKISYLPGQVVIDSKTDPANSPWLFSTLIDFSNANASATILGTGTETLPGGGAAVPYVSFLFRATGGTNLSINPPPLWYFTLCAEDSATQANGLPKNYVTVQVDPVTGIQRTYRP